jgi:diadenosine tetraphosphate (Ap4A) HIT family hydrolase
VARWHDEDEWTGLRDGSRCPICTNGPPRDVVAELPTTWVTAPQVTPSPGYLCIVSKRHVVEPYELSTDERAAFWEESLSVAELLNEEFRPIKLNYEIHGNTIPHLHLHLYPRFRSDAFEDGPIDPQRHTSIRSEEELDQIRRLLSSLN